jgi:hypothetical protein
MTKEQELHNLMSKAQYQITRRGRCSNKTGIELYEALKAKIKENGL